MPLRNQIKTWAIFYYHDMEETAKKVQECLGDSGVLCNVAWNKFNDGFPNLFVSKDAISALEGCDGTCFIISLHSPEVIFEQMSLLYTLPKMCGANFRIILPWFSTGTMERVETYGMVATANILARMLSACPMGVGGPATVTIYDIHALGEQFYFTDNVLVELKTAVFLLVSKIEELTKAGDEVAIAFPDDGAHKRFHTKFEKHPMIICTKQRVGDERIVTIKEGEPKGKHVIIVDDLVQSGGTLLQCARPLREMGAKKVSCFVTHAVFPMESHTKFIDNPLIDKFWVTDSIPNTAQKINGLGPFEVLSLAPLIAKSLQRLPDES